MKLLGPLPRLAVVELVAAFVRLAVVRRQMPVDRHLPATPPQATRQAAGERLVQTPFQHGKRFGQALLQGGHHRLVGGALAKSRQAAETEIDRAAARSKMFSTTAAVHFQPWSCTSFACNNQSSAHL